MFDSATTYLGILATFLVLCLFNDINNEKEDSNNFLLRTIVHVGNDLFRMLIFYVEKLRKEIESIHDGKKELNDPDVRNILSRLEQDKNPESQNLKDDILANLEAATFYSNEFYNKGSEIRKKYKPESIHGDMEFPFISMFTLVMLIVLLMIDTFNFIPIPIKALFTNLLLIIGWIYLGFICWNFFRRKKLESATPKARISMSEKSIPRMFLLCLLPFALWLVSSMFINNSIVSYISAFIILSLGLYMIKHRLIHSLCNNNDYFNRLLILRHCCFILSAVIFMTVIIAIISKFHPHTPYILDKYWDTWTKNMLLLQNVELARYMSVVFFTAFSFIVPVTIGYIFLKIQVKKNKKEIKKVHSKYVESISACKNAYNEYKRKAESRTWQT